MNYNVIMWKLKKIIQEILGEFMEEERLQKYLAECGVASRRKCEEFIEEGRVFVNGKKVNLKEGELLILWTQAARQLTGCFYAVNGFSASLRWKILWYKQR